MELANEPSRADKALIESGNRLAQIAQTDHGKDLKSILLLIADNAMEDMLKAKESHSIVAARSIVSFCDQFLVEWNGRIDLARSLREQMEEERKRAEEEASYVDPEPSPVSLSNYRADAF
jgi:hypothetical protein